MMSSDSPCFASLDPLGRQVSSRMPADAPPSTYQYCALPCALWKVRPWMVRYWRMFEVMVAVVLALSSRRAESLSPSAVGVPCEHWRLP